MWFIQESFFASISFTHVTLEDLRLTGQWKTGSKFNFIELGVQCFNGRSEWPSSLENNGSSGAEGFCRLSYTYNINICWICTQTVKGKNWIEVGVQHWECLHNVQEASRGSIVISRISIFIDIPIGCLAFSTLHNHISVPMPVEVHQAPEKEIYLWTVRAADLYLILSYKWDWCLHLNLASGEVSL